MPGAFSFIAGVLCSGKPERDNRLSLCLQRVGTIIFPEHPVRETGGVFRQHCWRNLRAIFG